MPGFKTPVVLPGAPTSGLQAATKGYVDTGDAGSTISALTAATAVADADLIPIVQGGTTKKATRALVVRPIPIQLTMFHNGVSGVYTAPTAATNAEAATAPMSRVLQDLTNVSQARLIVGMRTLGLGYTTALFRARYATNGITQSAWADLAATANAGDQSLMGGTASIIRTTAWFDIASGAKTDPAVLALYFVSTGTGTTAATVSFVDLLLR